MARRVGLGVWPPRRPAASGMLSLRHTGIQALDGRRPGIATTTPFLQLSFYFCYCLPNQVYGELGALLKRFPVWPARSVQ